MEKKWSTRFHGNLPHGRINHSYLRRMGSSASQKKNFYSGIDNKYQVHASEGPRETDENNALTPVSPWSKIRSRRVGIKLIRFKRMWTFDLKNFRP